MRKRYIPHSFILLVIQALIIPPGLGYALPNRDTLAPVLQINNNLFLESFYNVNILTPVDKVNVVLADQKQERDGYLNVLEISFKHDQPGILSSVLRKIGPDHTVAWYEMFKVKEDNYLKFGIITQQKKQALEITDSIGDINDVAYTKYGKSNLSKWVLNISLAKNKNAMIDVSDYLSGKGINVPNFLTPVVESAGSADFVFELEIPEGVDVSNIKSDLQLIAQCNEGCVQLDEGQLIDTVLDEYLINNLDVDISTEQRKILRRAITIVSNRHISQARKDRKTPFVMHPVEIAKILINEFKIFNPEILRYLAQALGIKKDEVILMVLISAILHDAVEDKDINQPQINKRFDDLIAEIVDMVTKQDEHKDKEGEAIYLKRLVSRNDLVGIIAQILKIADRIHNLRTLIDNDPEFQRKTFFSTWDNIIPEFTKKIDFSIVKNKKLREVFEKAVEILEQELHTIGKDLEILDHKGKVHEQQSLQYEWEEKVRQKKPVLTLAEKKGIIAHGVWEGKEGLSGLADIIIKKYIKARETKFGMVNFAGPLRLQRKNEDFNDYQAESSGAYDPYFVILDPRIERRKVRAEIAKRRILLPGFYRAIALTHLGPDIWGIPESYHLAYLVPSRVDRDFIVEKLKVELALGNLHEKYVLEAYSKIITYREFLKIDGNIDQIKSLSFSKKAKTLIPQRVIDSSI